MEIIDLGRDIRQIIDDNENTYILNANGTYLIDAKTYQPIKKYTVDINDKEYYILSLENSLYINGQNIQRLDYIIYLAFTETPVNNNEELIHIDNDTLNNNIENLRVASLSDLIKEKENISQYSIDDSRIRKDIKKLERLGSEVKDHYEDLLKYLKIDPFHLPSRFVPTNGLAYGGTPGLYHAVLNKGLKHRIFYRVDTSSKVITIDIDNNNYKGIVNLLQAWGHDWNKNNDI